MNKNCSGVLLSDQINSILNEKEERRVRGITFFTLKPKNETS